MIGQFVLGCAKFRGVGPVTAEPNLLIVLQKIVRQLVKSWKKILLHNPSGSGSCMFLDLSRRGTRVRQR
jgi:hypothetical protein